MATSIPIFPCSSLDPTLDFYQALGFDLTYRQDEPYLYASIQRDDLILHFSKLSMWGTKNAVCLVFVPDIALYHRQFANALRKHYGKVPMADLPRITRYREGQTRFHLFDPAGNILIYIDQNEPEQDFTANQSDKQEIDILLENACFLRDTYVNDKAAARVLDLALQRQQFLEPIDIARIIANRAELALAMGDIEYSQLLRSKLKQIELSPEQEKQFHHELHAPDELEAWL